MSEAKEILDRRLASGEIDEAEYDRLVVRLTGASEPSERSDPVAPPREGASAPGADRLMYVNGEEIQLDRVTRAEKAHPKWVVLVFFLVPALAIYEGFDLGVAKGVQTWLLGSFAACPLFGFRGVRVHYADDTSIFIARFWAPAKLADRILEARKGLQGI